MSKVTNVLELSLASSVDPQLAERRHDEILDIINPVKRLGALALHSFAVALPEVTARLINRDLRTHDLEYAGAGTHSIVYRKRAEVIKVHHRSIYYSEAERQDLAEQKRFEHSAMVDHMSEFLVGQTIGVAPHPANARRRAVQIFQPYVRFDDFKFFAQKTGAIHEAAIVAACEANPGMNGALLEFVHKGQQMFEKTGFLPDTCGPANVVISRETSPRLLVIDEQPVGPEHPVVQDRIHTQLSLLNILLAA